jgi:hypothetical protein
VGAANPEQLKDYYQAILEDEQKNVTNLYVIFLTPKSEASRLKAEYDNLNIVDKNHHKKWLYWDSSPDEKSIISMIKKVLIREGVGEINPINEYMRHTLKAFIKHASSFTTPIKTARTLRGEDIGNVIDEAEITLLNGSKYIVTRRDSTQIQVFNAETEEKEVARHILSKFIDENKIAIQHETLNTRTIGKKFFEWKYQQAK